MNQSQKMRKTATRLALTRPWLPLLAGLGIALAAGPAALAKPPCPGHPSCPDSGGEDGHEIAMDCELLDSATDTLLSDGMGVYADAVVGDGQQNVACRTGATGRAGLSGLVFAAYVPGKKGKNSIPAERALNLAMGYCAGANCAQPGDALLPAGVFDDASLEYLRVEVRPYSDTQTDIQSLPPGRAYSMALRINDQHNQWKINLAGRAVAGENLEGVLCGDDPDAVTTDVNVYVWPDVNPKNGVPDGYTVTTGSFAYNHDPASIHPDAPGVMRAAICSNEGPLNCKHFSDRWCNFLGEADMQFTIYMLNQ